MCEVFLTRILAGFPLSEQAAWTREVTWHLEPIWCVRDLFGRKTQAFLKVVVIGRNQEDEL